MKSTAIARNCKSVNCAEIVNNNKTMKEGITFCGTSVTVTVTKLMHIALSLVRPAVGACRVHIHLLNGSGTPIKPCTHTIFMRYNQLNGTIILILLAGI